MFSQLSLFLNHAGFFAFFAPFGADGSASRNAPDGAGLCCWRNMRRPPQDFASQNAPDGAGSCGVLPRFRHSAMNHAGCFPAELLS